MTDRADKRRAALDALAALDVCLECGGPLEHQHHVVPRSRGGKVVVPLCHFCHGKAHHQTQVGLGLEHKRRRCFAGEIDRTAAGIEYGYRPTADGGVERDEGGEWDTLVRVVDLYNAGHGCRALARILDEEGVRNRKGKPWCKDNITQMLRAVRDGAHDLSVVPKRRELDDLRYGPRPKTLAARDMASALRSQGKTLTEIGAVLRARFPQSKWVASGVHFVLNGDKHNGEGYTFNPRTQTDATIRAELAVMALRKEEMPFAKIAKLLNAVGVKRSLGGLWTEKSAQKVAAKRRPYDVYVGADTPGRMFSGAQAVMFQSGIAGP